MSRPATLPAVVPKERHGRHLVDTVDSPHARIKSGWCSAHHYSEHPDYHADALYINVNGNTGAATLLKGILGGAATYEREVAMYRVDLCLDNWHEVMRALEELNCWWAPRVTTWLRRRARDLNDEAFGLEVAA